MVAIYLTKIEELKLLIQIKEGSEKAKKELVETNQFLVAAVVSKYSQKEVSFQELFDLGNKGLERAIRLFVKKHLDVTKFKFSTYATCFIRNEVHKKLGLPSN